MARSSHYYARGEDALRAVSHQTARCTLRISPAFRGARSRGTLVARFAESPAMVAGGVLNSRIRRCAAAKDVQQGSTIDGRLQASLARRLRVMHEPHSTFCEGAVMNRPFLLALVLFFAVVGIALMSDGSVGVAQAGHGGCSCSCYGCDGGCYCHGRRGCHGRRHHRCYGCNGCCGYTACDPCCNPCCDSDGCEVEAPATPEAPAAPAPAASAASPKAGKAARNFSASRRVAVRR